MSDAKGKALKAEKRTETRKGQQNGHTFRNGPEVNADKRRKNVVEHLTALGCEVVQDSREEATKPDVTDEEIDNASMQRDAAEPESKPDLILSHLGTIVLGLPSWINQKWSLATMAINIILVLGVVDVVYRGPMLHPSHDLSFTRVGFVSENSAKVLVREPNATRTPLYVSYRGVSGGPDTEDACICCQMIRTTRLLLRSQGYVRRLGTSTPCQTTRAASSPPPLQWVTHCQEHQNSPS